MPRFLVLVGLLFLSLAPLRSPVAEVPPSPNLFLTIQPFGPVKVGAEFTVVYRFGNIGTTYGGLALMTFYTPVGLELVGQPQGASASCTVLRAERQPVVACTVEQIPTHWFQYVMLRYRVRARAPTTVLLRGDIDSPFDDSDMGNNHLSYALEVVE